jgi:hypothetical protein
LALQIIAEVTEQVWAQLKEDGSIVHTDAVSYDRARLTARVLNEHLQHKYLLLNRIHLPAGTFFHDLPAWKPFPSDECLREEVCALVLRCVSKPITFDGRPQADRTEMTDAVHDMVRRQWAAENAPITKVKVHGQILTALETRIFQQLLKDTVQWVLELDDALALEPRTAKELESILAAEQDEPHWRNTLGTWVQPV